jgi:hypothetical protein
MLAKLAAHLAGDALSTALPSALGIWCHSPSPAAGPAASHVFAGSLMLAKIAAHLAGDAFSIAGRQNMALPLVLPSATGMALTITPCFCKLLLGIAVQAPPWLSHWHCAAAPAA